MSEDPPSPCNRICVIDERSGWCRGCKRTLDEIAAWPNASPGWKHALRARLRQR
ncbi:MAG: DUF1289 domain-containing protein [Novosphingobium sp.]